ncbi:GRF zinc finger domain-containing protein [Hirsutella rhossiliensis]|uniref:GRF zinc finger domain-containing protein n=1 Tax=Hirsutella rhossiliensis TaxID=111463 RepID=A0A9P8MYA2_9HYPO|nr:GRF zinc finger domain-containing protein [Hirsutella rhossiliensis]KAH0963187.1 GRF zinc finger domain-containing protein [Hirsutella rhossiliensis]
MGATTPPRRRRHSPETPASQKKRLDGLWQGGHWWCNCEPRKKAALREVKKDTPNKGKFFWACPGYPYCSFFLWRDEALVRQAGLLSAAGDAAAEELPPGPKTPTFTQRPLTSFGVQVSPGRSGVHVTDLSTDNGAGPSSSGSGSKTTTTTSASTSASASATTANEVVATPCPNSSKRSRDAFEQGDDDFSDFGSDEERQLADIADSSTERSARKVDVLATPKSGGLAGAPDLPSPSVARTLFPGPEPKRQKTVTFDDDAQPTGLPTPVKSPATSRPGNPGIPSSSPPDADLDTVVDDVVALLRDQPIDGAVLDAVRELLAASVRKTRGIAMGRESARAALKQKDDQIARLQARVTALENRERSQESQLTSIKAGLMKMYQDN